MTKPKLIAKIFITGKIKAETGLHIGGSKSSLDIGGVDLNVIKTPKGEPFIPGSSLKGKLRSMLARAEGSEAVNRSGSENKEAMVADEDFNYLNQLFGRSGDDKDSMAKGETTRVVVRDAGLDTKAFEELDFDLDDEFTTVKWENTIDRRKGTAEHPRQLERVPAGAEFDFEIVYDLYSDCKDPYEYSAKEKEIYGERPKNNQTKAQKHAWSLLAAMKMLESDYLGGQGSRGYGKIKFQGVKVTQKSINAELSAYENSEVHEAFQGISSHFE
jgi:CRISPR-associated protein Csm3